jgi:cystathionine gamma-lyase
LLNGHSDAVFGHVSSRNTELLAGVQEWRRVCGAIPGPFETWMVQRGLETLEVRLARMHANALALAQALQGLRGKHVVRYPGLSGHAQHALAGAQMNGYGCLIGLTLPSQQAAEHFLQECRYLRSCTSFGGVHTSAERRARWGDAVAEGFLRVSVGCEPTDALCGEFLRALEATSQ